MKLQVGIIGNSIKHSLSPIIQNLALKTHNINANYEIWDTPIPELKNRIDLLKQDNVLGANVTIPYKEQVIPWLDSLSDEVKTIGAVNTIINRKGQLHGENTDSRGFIKDLTDRHNISVTNKNILVLGAGGSSKAIIYGLLKNNCQSITIINRTQAKAEDIVNKFSYLGNIKTVSSKFDQTKDLSNFDIIINCTSFGMKHSELEGQLPIPQNLVKQCRIFYDLVYNPPITPIILEIQKYGGIGINGIGMLIEQAGLSFKLWTGLEPPIDSMYSVLNKKT